MDLFTIVTARADYELGALVIIDQTQLPEREVYLALKTPEEIWEAIYLLKVRGAPAIGVAAAYGISVCMQKVDEVGDFYREFARVKNYLASLEAYRYGAGLIFPAHGGKFVYGIGANGSRVVEMSRCGGGSFETSLAGRGRGDSERRCGGVPENWRTWIVTVETGYGLAHAL